MIQSKNLSCDSIILNEAMFDVRSDGLPLDIEVASFQKIEIHGAVATPA